MFINDNSTDSSFHLLNKIAKKYSFIHVLNNPNEGKKSAVKLGVEAAKYNVICQTDADCEVKEYWIMSTITKLFSEKTDLVLGPVYPFKTKGLLNGLIRLEWLAMQFITVLTACLKNPGMANGANMAFRKEVFLEMDESIECQVRPRSGLALKKGITVLNTPGTIDADYRGELGVILMNQSKETVVIHSGDRIAQLVFAKVEKVKLVNVTDVNVTKRGDGGFGSTGIK
mgnify:CR=1 FL=1